MSALAILTALLAISPVPSPTPPAPVLLLPGEFHGDEVALEDGAGALALCEGGTELRAVQVTVRAVHDALVDDDPEVRSGREVGAPCNPVALFAGVPGLQEGPVQPASQVHSRLPAPGRPGWRLAPWWMRLTLGEKSWRISQQRRGEAGVRATLSGGGAPQRVLFEAEDVELSEEDWAVQWAGDLNGDGALDLLVETFHANGSTHTLLLSDGEGGALREVARFSSVGC
jgi:hypothetical protein